MQALKNLFKSNDEIVQEIHNEVNTAQDRLLQTAQTLLIELKPNNDKANRLERLGFISTQEVLKAKKDRKIYEMNKDTASLVRYYKENYPFLKFLTKEELERICNKYSLVYASVDSYLKEVPEKNILEIENAQKLKSEDKVDYAYVVKFKNRYKKAKRDFQKVIKFLGKDTFTGDEIMTIRKRYNLGVHSTFADLFYDISHLKDTNGDRICSTSVFSETEVSRTNLQGLFIAAPKSHFNLKGLKKKGFGFLSTSVFEVKDPIVFRHVKGGVQVLSKWGLEANDPDLANELLN